MWVAVGEPMMTASISPDAITADGSLEIFPPNAAVTFLAFSSKGSTT